MLEGHTYCKQLFKNEAWRVFMNTFLNGHEGIINNIMKNCEIENKNTNVLINTGYFLIQGGLLNVSDEITLSVSKDENTHCRVICEIDLNKNNSETVFSQGSFKIIGAKGSYPNLVKEDIIREKGIYQYEFARFQKKANTDVITDFFDTRSYLDFNSVYLELQNKIATFNNDFANWLQAFSKSSEIEFNTWFDAIKEILDEDVASKLLNMIGLLKDLETQNKSNLVSAINENINNFINVKNYGATGDGITDDTIAIQNAINEGATKKRTVYFPAGNYKITKPINVPSATHILGTGMTQDGDGAKIVPVGNMAAAFLVENINKISFGIVIENLSIIGNNYNCHGIYFKNTGNGNNYYPFVGIEVKNVYCRFCDSAILAEGLITSKIENVQAWECNIGINLNSFNWRSANTSITLNNCYANGCVEIGYNIKYSTYITFNSCACDSCPNTAYDVEMSSGISFNSCGSEWGETEKKGVSYKFGLTGNEASTRGITLNACYSYNCPQEWLIVGQNCVEVVVNACVEDGENAVTDNAVVIKDGSRGICLISVNTFRQISGNADILLNRGRTITLKDIDARKFKLGSPNGTGTTTVVAQNNSNNTLTLPNNNDVLVGRATLDTFTGRKNFGVDTLQLNSKTNGYCRINNADNTKANTVTIPDASGMLAVVGTNGPDDNTGAGQVGELRVLTVGNVSYLFVCVAPNTWKKVVLTNAYPL